MDIYNGTYAIFKSRVTGARRTENETFTEFVVFRFDGNNSALTIGRAASSDYQLKDLSVSNKNSSLVLEGSKLFIKDHKSRFGSCIRHESDILESGHYYQVGNILLKVEGA